MELIDFYNEINAEIITAYNNRSSNLDLSYPYEEKIFTEVVLNHMVDSSLCPEDFELCFFEKKFGKRNIKLNGYVLSQDESPELFLFVTDYRKSDEIETISLNEVKKNAEKCFAFLEESKKGAFEGCLSAIDPSYDLYMTIKSVYSALDSIHIFVLTNLILKGDSKEFGCIDGPDGKKVKLSLMDIERLYRHAYSGTPRDELVVDFSNQCGSSLPCIYVPAKSDVGYDYALAAIPGNVLYYLYEKYGSRLLEENVRSFLQLNGKVNKGISKTLRNEPEKFMAFNNGLVIVADEVGYESDPKYGISIRVLKGLQIVNGGQTTASIYFTKRKYKNETNLDIVRVPAKIIITGKVASPEDRDKLFSDISLYANSQNTVKQSDLSSNKTFHKTLERIFSSLYCDDGMTRWFYERTTGSYNEKKKREGGTPALLKQFNKKYPVSNKITKTELGVYINSWDLYPYFTAMGPQKNFKPYMDRIIKMEQDSQFEPDILWVKQAIAKAIIFKQSYSVVSRLKTLSAKAVAAYLVSLISYKYANKIDLVKIWKNQKLSDELCLYLAQCAEIINSNLERKANEKSMLFTEYVKKPYCWDDVKNCQYPELNSIPEFE